MRDANDGLHDRHTVSRPVKPLDERTIYLDPSKTPPWRSDRSNRKAEMRSSCKGIG